MSFILKVADTEQPEEFVQVIVVVPDATPVTNPELEIVATPVLLDVHGFDAAGVPEPVSCVVALIQVLNVPLIVGLAFTTTVALAVVVHEFAPVTVTVQGPAAETETEAPDPKLFDQAQVPPPLAVKVVL